MSASLGDAISFIKSVSLEGLKNTPEAGTQFGDVFQTLGRGAATGVSDVEGIGSQISNFFSNLGKSLFSNKSIPSSDISGANTGFPSNTVNTIQNIPRTVSTINPNIIAGSAAVGATAIGTTLIFTNPGVQQTAQSYSSGLNALANAGEGATNFLTQNPLILIGLIGLGAIVLLKK